MPKILDFIESCWAVETTTGEDVDMILILADDVSLGCDELKLPETLADVQIGT